MKIGWDKNQNKISTHFFFSPSLRPIRKLRTVFQKFNPNLSGKENIKNTQFFKQKISFSFKPTSFFSTSFPYFLPTSHSSSH